VLKEMAEITEAGGQCGVAAAGGMLVVQVGGRRRALDMGQLLLMDQAAQMSLVGAALRDLSSHTLPKARFPETMPPPPAERARPPSGGDRPDPG